MSHVSNPCAAFLRFVVAEANTSMWHYEADGKSNGPVSIAELQRFAEEKVVAPVTLVWTEGMSEWTPFATVFASCAECSGLFAVGDVIRFGSDVVCAQCKPLYLQKLREGVAPRPVGQRLASRWRRLGASLIDGLLLMSVVFPLQYATGAFERSAAAAQGSPFAPLTQFRPEQALWTVFGFLILLAFNWRFLAKG